MSRIGKLPVTVPAGVDVTIDGTTVTAKGAKGELTRTFPEIMTIKREGDDIIVERPNDSREAKAYHGLVRTLIANMVEGVSAGFSKKLQLVRCSSASPIPCWWRLPRTSRSRCPARPRSS